MRILIAEDDPVSRRLLEARLAKWGYEPVVAEDGPGALALLESGEGPRLAILDWMMPGLEGPEVVRRVRAAEAGRGDSAPVHFVLLTSRQRSRDVVEGLEAGADDYVTKPFEPDELHARVRAGARILGLRDALAARVTELQDALARVRTLEGLLPICSYCKKVRDDRNYWTDVEAYLERVSRAEFTHGVCPGCYDTHVRPRLDERRREREASREA